MELLKYMIIDSDNTAKNTLLNQLSMSEIDTIFTHIGISNPYITSEVGLISPRDYIRLFKSLYYSTYLSPATSELALDLTTDTEEESLISKGVPAEVQVAHKFGMFGETEIHDCGVVYHKENPYFLCIMSSLPIDEGNRLIPIISRDIYDFIEEKSNGS
jgi:beta-lactamase class A